MLPCKKASWVFMSTSHMTNRSNHPEMLQRLLNRSQLLRRTHQRPSLGTLRFIVVLAFLDAYRVLDLNNAEIGYPEAVLSSMYAYSSAYVALLSARVTSMSSMSTPIQTVSSGFYRDRLITVSTPFDVSKLHDILSSMIGRRKSMDLSHWPFGCCSG